MRLTNTQLMLEAEAVAKTFHETYEQLAPDFNYKTREASAKPWEDVPEDNRNLMIAVAKRLICQNVIQIGVGLQV